MILKRLIPILLVVPLLAACPSGNPNGKMPGRCFQTAPPDLFGRTGPVPRTGHRRRSRPRLHVLLVHHHAPENRHAGQPARQRRRHDRALGLHDAQSRRRTALRFDRVQARRDRKGHSQQTGRRPERRADGLLRRSLRRRPHRPHRDECREGRRDEDRLHQGGPSTTTTPKSPTTDRNWNTVSAARASTA